MLDPETARNEFTQIHEELLPKGEGNHFHHITKIDLYLQAMSVIGAERKVRGNITHYRIFLTGLVPRSLDSRLPDQQRS